MSELHDLRFILSHAATSLLSAREERTLADRIWLARRELCGELIRAEDPRRFSKIPPKLETHRNPLPRGLMHRLLEAEQRARALPGEAMTPRVSDALFSIEECRSELFEHNLRLVAWIAKGFVGKGLDLADLFQEGALALVWSIDRYDPARGTRLSTFASHVIRLTIVRALSDRGRPIRVPNYRLKEVVETTKARSVLLHRLGREPRTEELARETGLPQDAIDELVPAVRPFASIDAPVAGMEHPLSDVLSDDGQPTPFERTLAAETKRLAGLALAQLPDRERRIVTMRYGIEDDEERTYEDIGRTLGISRERTRQLERSAREKLRGWLSAS